MVVVNPLRIVRGRAGVPVATVEIRRSVAVLIDRAVHREAVQQHADVGGLAERRREPQRFDVVVILIRWRWMAVVPIEREDFAGERRASGRVLADLAAQDRGITNCLFSAGAGR